MNYTIKQVFERLQQIDFLLTHKQMLLLTDKISGREGDQLLEAACEQGVVFREKIWGLYLYAGNRTKFYGNRASQKKAFLTIMEEGFILSDRWMVNRLAKYTGQRYGWQLDKSAVRAILRDLIVEGTAIKFGAISGKDTRYNCTYPASKHNLFRLAIDSVFSIVRDRNAVYPRDLWPLKKQLGEYGRNWEVFVLDHLVYLGELDRFGDKSRYVIPGRV
jgi:hypothetical protein